MLHIRSLLGCALDGTGSNVGWKLLHLKLRIYGMKPSFFYAYDHILEIEAICLIELV